MSDATPRNARQRKMGNGIVHTFGSQPQMHFGVQKNRKAVESRKGNRTLYVLCGSRNCFVDAPLARPFRPPHFRVNWLMKFKEWKFEFKLRQIERFERWPTSACLHCMRWLNFFQISMFNARARKCDSNEYAVRLFRKNIRRSGNRFSGCNNFITDSQCAIASYRDGSKFTYPLCHRAHSTYIRCADRDSALKTRFFSSFPFILMLPFFQCHVQVVVAKGHGVADNHTHTSPNCIWMRAPTSIVLKCVRKFYVIFTSELRRCWKVERRTQKTLRKLEMKTNSSLRRVWARACFRYHIDCSRCSLVRELSAPCAQTGTYLSLDRIHLCKNRRRFYR